MNKARFSELRSKMPAEAQAQARALADHFLREMPLAELRRARAQTQQELAISLNVNQAWVSKLERQTDMYLSTLRGYVEALGGELEIVARFHNGSVRLSSLGEVTRSADVAPPAVAEPLSNAYEAESKPNAFVDASAEGGPGFMSQKDQMTRYTGSRTEPVTQAA